MSENYLPWIVGFGFSVIVGHLAIRGVVDRLRGADGRTRRERRRAGAVGMTERALFTAAILVGSEFFIAAWLALKALGQWGEWGKGPTHSEADHETKMRELHTNFLISQGLSVGFAAAGAFVTELLRDEKLTPAVLIAVAVLLGTLALAAFIPPPPEADGVSRTDI